VVVQGSSTKYVWGKYDKSNVSLVIGLVVGCWSCGGQ
jgi:hypothetical protein